MFHFHCRFSATPVKLSHTLLLCITKVALLFGFMAFSLSTHATPAVTWSPPVLSRWFFPGQQYHTTITFISSVSLRNIGIFVVPELRPFVTVHPAVISEVQSNTTYSISLMVTI